MPDTIRYLPQDRGITKIALMRGDEELSRALVVPMTVQLGKARLRMDGIGDVATPEAHRGLGYSRRVLEAAVDFMTAGDAVVSTLFGIPRFYPKYGYATLGPEYTIAPTSLDERDQLPADHTVRVGTAADLAAMQRLYRQETANAYGAVVRDDDWRAWDELADALDRGANEVRVVERGGHVVGYAWQPGSSWWMAHISRDQPSALRVGEAFATDLAAAEATLAMCRLWTRDLGLPALELAIPPTCLVGTAARFQNARVTELYGDETEFMGRSVGLVALLQALQPELEAQWLPVSGSMPPFALGIATGEERATIAGDDHGITIETQRPGDVQMSLDPGTLARLVFGGFESQTLMTRIEAPATAVSLIATLFPKHIPYIYPVDRF